MAYFSGIAATHDDIVVAITNAASADGWTVNRSGIVGAAKTLGREALLSKGSCFVSLRSMADFSGYTSMTQANGFPATFIRGATGYDPAKDWEDQPGSWKLASSSVSAGRSCSFIGNMVLWGRGFPAPTIPSQDISFPAAYRIFTFTNPDVVILVLRASPTHYQWIMFGTVTKFGTWTGGEFVGASFCLSNVATGGNYSPNWTFSPGGSSTYRSCAPFHHMSTGYYPGAASELSNTRVRMVLPGDTMLYNDNWACNGSANGASSGEARYISGNSISNPINSRSPNTFNQVAVMTPFWLITQHESDFSLVGRAEHIRQIPINNFNPEDTFTLGTDKWMVFPYFEKGGFTGQYGWAINANEIP